MKTAKFKIGDIVKPVGGNWAHFTIGRIAFSKWSQRYLAGDYDSKQDFFMDDLELYEEPKPKKLFAFDFNAEIRFFQTELAVRASDLLISINEKQANTNLTEVLSEIKKISVGHHVFPSDLLHRIGGTQENIRDTLIFATKSGIVAPVYKIKSSSYLEEGENEWTSNLGSLNKFFTDEHGNLINGGDPSNIEVAFLRVAQEEQSL